MSDRGTQRFEALPRPRAEASGALAKALDHATRLLQTAPALAEAQAIEILRVLPGQSDALLIQGIARRRAGDLVGAAAIFERLVDKAPARAGFLHEFGLTVAAQGRGEAAQAAFRRAVALDPGFTESWRALGDQLTLAGDAAGADAAYAESIRTSTRNPVLMEAAAALCDGRLAVAERMLKDHLKRAPTDVAAIRMLAELATRLGRNADAENLLARCLELAPGFDAARHNYVVVLQRAEKAAEALVEIDRLLAREPRDPTYLNLKAGILVQIGEYAAAIELYARVLADFPQLAKVWLNQGHVLKTAGRRADSIAAYRRSIALMPHLGEAYWSLANLKTFRFDADDVDAMSAQLARPDLADEDRLHFHFALGKALEDREDYAASFDHYAEGNRIRRAQLRYDPDLTSKSVARQKALFDPAFLTNRRGFGADAPDPIFIVGLPRSGSTLIEQILSSHSMVEGTMELPELLTMVRLLGGRRKADDVSHYPEILRDLDEARFRELGESYIEKTRIHRKTGKPFFIDKMPNNFLHVGFIHAILPNAKIIDARRHPLGACFSGFKQHFARGQPFSYDLGDLGRYYADYVDLMAHVDRVLPGRIHRIFYERMVTDTEAETRRLLDHCGLPFEDSCLRFYENARAVRTASSEQVRQPIFQEGIDHWRHYEPWLDPLKAALGDSLATYPSQRAG
jgi:tetratricopeptide (TPR) repeat protein